MDSHMEIDDWRKRIDELTDTIISLLNRRAEFARVDRSRRNLS